ncbi:MAG TPA: sigma-70 family RNA polymerase sigma factor, partial [Verrucomicrobiae bacterium]
MELAARPGLLRSIPTGVADVEDYSSSVLSLTHSFVDLFPLESNGLLAQAQAGDAAAFGELCRLYETRLLRQALALCSDLTLAEDLAQETFIEAWKCLRRYNGRCQFFTWLCAILLNRHHNTMRKKNLFFRLGWSRDDGKGARNEVREPADDSLSPDELAARREQALLLQNSIAELPTRHQQVVYLRFFADCSLQEIGAALGCSVGTVKSR